MDGWCPENPAASDRHTAAQVECIAPIVGHEREATTVHTADPGPRLAIGDGRDRPSVAVRSESLAESMGHTDGRPRLVDAARRGLQMNRHLIADELRTHRAVNLVHREVRAARQALRGRRQPPAVDTHDSQEVIQVG